MQVLIIALMDDRQIYISRLYSAVRCVTSKEVPLDIARLEASSEDEAVRMLIDAYGPVAVYEASKKLYGPDQPHTQARPSVAEKKEIRDHVTEQRKPDLSRQAEHRPAWSAASGRDD